MLQKKLPPLFHKTIYIAGSMRLREKRKLKNSVLIAMNKTRKHRFQRGTLPNIVVFFVTSDSDFVIANQSPSGLQVNYLLLEAIS